MNRRDLGRFELWNFYYSAGDRTVALDWWRQVAEVARRFYSILAVGQAHQGDLLAAQESAGLALEIDLRYPAVYVELGKNKAPQSDIPNAQRSMLRALQVDSRYASAHRELGNLLGSVDAERALESWCAYDGQRPGNALIYVAIARVYRIEGGYEEALT